MKKFLLRTATVSIAFAMLSLAVVAQNVSVSGAVIDAATGEPLIGVTVVVQGLPIGTTTGVGGTYNINAPAKGKLTFSMIGYESFEASIDSKTKINVKLKESSVAMEEVVAIGYANVRKSNLTSSISTVTEKDIMKTPINSIEQALQGNAAGVLVINTSAEPGGEITMRIRGGSSISGSNEPLIVIDGFPSDNSALSMLNPNDVKSMEVLKDASATAIYGSRGANGVVMVTTKGGEGSKAVVGVNANIGISVPRRKMPVMDGPQFAMYDNYARMAWGANSLRSARPDTLGTTNFQDLLIKDIATRQEYTVNVSGQSPSKDMKYYVSANILDESGLLNNSGSQRMSYRGKFNIKLHKKVDMEITSSMGRTQNQKIGGGGTGAILRTLMLNPAGSYDGRFEDGVFYDEDTGEPLSTQTEVSRAMNGNDWTKKFETNVGAFITWRINSEWSFNTRGQYGYSDSRAYAYMPRSIFLKMSDLDKNNKATREASQSLKWVNENYFNYNPSFKNKKQYMNLTLGQSWEQSTSDGFGITVRRFDTDYYMWNNLAAGAYIESPKTSSNKNSLISLFSRLIYNYDNRFLTSWAIRADGSSRFGEDKKFGYFPSGSVAWVISREKFMRSVPSISTLKVRLGAGITGNNGIGNFNSLNLLSSSKIVIGGNTYNGNSINRLGNSNLQWETERQLNLGIDMGLLKDRIVFAIDLYTKRTYNQLYSYRVPESTGYSTVMANIGSTRNQGVEFEITSRNITNRKFQWTTTFNMGYNTNKVLNLGGNDYVTLYYLGDNVNQNITYLMLGQPQAVFMGYKTTTYKNWDEVYADNAIWLESSEVIKTVPGMPRYVDKNGDGTIDDQDLYILGQGQPKLMGGFTNTFSYKGLNLVVFFNGAWGGSVVNTNVSKLRRNKAGSDNQMSYMLDAYRPMNPSFGDSGYKAGRYPLPSSNSHATSTARDYTQNLTDNWVEDASYLRLKSITLSYDLPKKIVSKLGLSGLRFGVTGVNLLTFTEYTGYDPEMSSSQGSSAARLGIDLSSYPPSKGVTFNVNLTF